MSNRLPTSYWGHRTAARTSSLRVPASGPQAGARLQPVDVTVLERHRNRRNAVIQGQIAWIYSAGQGTEATDDASADY